MSALATLRAAGLTASVHGNRLHVEPAAKLTDDLRVFIREHKPAIIAELAPPSRPVSAAPIACQSCRHFQARPGQAPDGHCRRFNTATWANVEFRCDGYSAADRAARAPEARRHKVADLLRADPALRYAYDVENASPRGAASAPVSVVIGLRDSSGTIVTGELTVPAERWDMAAFLAYWDAQGRPS